MGYEYAWRYRGHLQGLIISDMVASVPGYVTYIAGLRNPFPAEVVRRIEQYEANGQFDQPAYQKLVFEQLYSRHICRLDPWPEPLERALKFMNGKIYNYLQGPNEFVITGTLKDWDRTRDLKDIKAAHLAPGRPLRHHGPRSNEAHRLSPAPCARRHQW